MNLRLVFSFLVLIGFGMFAGGCGTTGPTAPDFDPSKPHTFLPGAEVQQAKSVAMGSAVSKGWKIIDASGNQLLVGREIAASTAQSVMGAPVSAAMVEVHTGFSARGDDGVDVVAVAALIANKGTDAEEKIDFTQSYIGELNRSLDSLQQSWNANRWRVAASTPPLPPERATSADVDMTKATPAVRAWHDAVNATQPSPRQGVTAASLDDSPETPVPVAAPVVAASADGAPGPDAYRPTAETPPPAAAAAPAPSAEENMLALNRAAEPGVWAYYAEHYARIRGCEVSASGAALEEKQPEYEIHRVYCNDGQSFRVKCNAGTCGGLQ